MLLSALEIERELLAPSLLGPDHLVPRYDGFSTINLSSSIVQALGGEPISPGLRPEALDAAVLMSARTIVFLVVDALGYDQLHAEIEAGHAPALQRLLASSATRFFPITTVFPSTTSAALVSLQTGASPREHGNAGLSVYLPQLNGIANLLYFYLAENPSTSLTTLGIEANNWLAVPTMYQRLARAGVPSYKVNPGEYTNSPLSIMTSVDSTYVPYVNASDFFSQTRRAIAQARQHPRGLVFAYWPGVDTIGHFYGSGSPEYATQIQMFDWLFQREFLDQVDLADTALVITADHGQNNTAPDRTILLNDYPRILEWFQRAPGGDQRARYLFVAPDQVASARNVIATTFPDVVSTLPLPDYLWLFGRGTPHPEFADRVGNLIALPGPGWNLAFRYRPDEKMLPLVGLHGGLHRSEMLVPAIVHRP